jgi:nucleotide-binding universal stress UspA family protein
MLAIKTILHPTDFSEGSDYAFRLACSLARDYGAKVVILHVVAPPVVAYGEGIVPPEPEDYQEALRAQLLEVQPRDPRVPVEHLFVEGEAATEILAAAVDTMADVIVLGTHGRTGLGRVMMGSVAEQVLRRAPCPVLTVKTPIARPRTVSASVPQEAEKVVAATNA